MIQLLSRRSLVAVLVSVFSVILFSAGYFQENREAYLFPSIVAFVILVFSITSLFREVFNLCVDDFVTTDVLRLIPALACMVFALFAIEPLGMYTTAVLVLFFLSFWYSPHDSMKKKLIFSVILSVCFIIVMYVLFSVLLGVQTPRGLFI